MNDESRRFKDTLIAIDKFGDDNIASFPPTSPGGIQFALVKSILASLENAAADQIAGFGETSQQVEIKGTNRLDLRNRLAAISRTAKSMEYAFDGISNKFRMPRNRNDADLLATARAWVIEATPFKTDFNEYGLPAAFITDLTNAADEFEASLGEVAAAVLDRVESTADITDWVTQGMRSRLILDGIVQNVFDGDKGKLAAWASAKHIEKAPKKAPSPIPPLPPTP